MFSSLIVFPGRWRAPLAAFLLLAIVAPARGAAPSVEQWLADFRRYAAQPNLQDDSRYSGSAGPKLHFGEVLNRLPEPAQWPQLRAALDAAAARAPAGIEQQQLAAGRWLALYLTGDRAALLVELPETKTDTPAGYALGALRAALTEVPGEPRSSSTEKDVKEFERQLDELDPVKVEDVKKVLGGEENFARLHRILDAGAAMQPRVFAIYEEFEKTKDEAAAKKKFAALQEEFEAAHGADQKILEPLMQDPLVERYIFGLQRQQGAEDYVQTLGLPDLVRLAGPERAKALLQRAVAGGVALSADSRTGEATVALAREIIMASIDTVKAPSWGLVQSVGAVPFFEALQKRFPNVSAGSRDFAYEQACGYYLVALIQQERVPEAVAFASRIGRAGRLDLPYDITSALEKGGQAEGLWQFLGAWLKKFPGSSEWDHFTRLSAELGHQQELKAMVKAMAADGSFDGLDRVRVQRLQADFELATNEFAAASQRLRALLQPVGASQEERNVQIEVVTKLLELADLLQDAVAYGKDTATAEAILAATPAKDGRVVVDEARNLVIPLNRSGHFADALRVAQFAWDRVPAARPAAKAGEEQEDFGLPDLSLRDIAAETLRANIELGRWKEAEKLVEKNSWWGGDDVADLLTEEVSSSRRPLGFYFALVAHHQGRKDREQRLLEAQLAAKPGADAPYESYLALVGSAAKPFLGKLLAADRYEERPLIWRAQLELDAGQWDAAIATLQQAIQIDPSDGEEGRGDRMRVYALMSRAVAAKGDKAKAEFFSNVVKSIRLSETADRWFELGAYERAIALYREALGFFQDAYCIQSRLAVRLAGEGKMDEAFEHYRKAFELMPDSFGRVESHCFGCEHVFAGEKSQGVAEEVFTRMLAARPQLPQLHYLMGYLREEQDRPAEAAEYFRKAVQLDPLYLNAWKRLAGLGSTLHLKPAERDDIILKSLEMDPLQRHSSSNLDEVSDLPRLWQGMQAADRIAAQLPAPAALWKLPASAAHRAAGKQNFFSSSSRRNHFGDVLAMHRFVQALQQYLAALQAPQPSQ